MKKSFLSLSIALSSMAVMSAANANTYIGAELGWGALNNACDLSAQCEDDNVAAGFYLGYELSPTVSIEYGVDYLSEVETNSVDGNSVAWLHSSAAVVSLTPKFDLQVSDNLELYTKVGAAYVRMGDHDDVAPTAALGLEYQMSRNWAARVELSHVHEVSFGSVNDMSMNFLTFGLTYGGRLMSQNQYLRQLSPPNRKKNQLFT